MNPHAYITDQKQIEALESIKRVDDKGYLYHMVCNYDYYSLPEIFTVMLSAGCSTFVVKNTEGEVLFCRNYDYSHFQHNDRSNPRTGLNMVIEGNNPKARYHSIGAADTYWVDYKNGSAVNGMLDDGKTDLSPFIISPYLCMDGMNEKGVGAGILQLVIDEPHQDNGKPDLLVFCAIRGILDYCASVDEALALLESYDIHSDLGNYHLFITDSTGRYVVVEWLDNEMVVTEYQCCTNSVIAPGEFYDMGDPDDRKDTINSCLANDREVTAEEAMAILDEVHNRKMTEWSCVYNLEDFTVSICLDADYSKVYTFSVEEFR